MMTETNRGAFGERLHGGAETVAVRRTWHLSGIGGSLSEIVARGGWGQRIGRLHDGTQAACDWIAREHPDWNVFVCA